MIALATGLRPARYLLRAEPPLNIARRRMLATALVATTSAAAPATRAVDDVEDGGALEVGGAYVAVAAAPPSPVAAPPSYADFLVLLRSRQVESVRFFDTFGLRGDAALRDGRVVEIGLGDGWPAEKPGSPESPLQFIAKVRDADVPYSFAAFDLTQYNQAAKKAKSYKNKNAIQAEKVGEEEAERVARKREAEAAAKLGGG